MAGVTGVNKTGDLRIWRNLWSAVSRQLLTGREGGCVWWWWWGGVQTPAGRCSSVEFYFILIPPFSSRSFMKLKCAGVLRLRPAVGQLCSVVWAVYIHHWEERHIPTNNIGFQSKVCVKIASSQLWRGYATSREVQRLAGVREYIIKITPWHWSLTTCIFWCNLLSCFIQPSVTEVQLDEYAGLSFQMEHKGHIWL